ncbi:transporter substrate-binding domain-containing protein [Pseudoalteromonas sp. T1lg24]|uniref:transporter substrate-binding domain-containing protein n=1 Tax=Pseudoalteromonas sp. T1lg24 TaxID=2077099 RepID=UPI000CF6232E|nr:transporter substrate-binding domain-containing protein [Pseudoalteromonas sp. T1lg24]
MKYILLLLFILPLQLAARLNQVEVYTYHNMPPYVIDLEQKSGLYFEFVELLNQMNSGYQFKLVYMPRKRIDHRLKQNKLNGVVIGVNPKWFRDPTQSRYHWTPKMMSDQDIFVSLSKHPVIVNELSDLENKRVGGIHGFKYVGVDSLANQQKLTRVNTQSETQLFDMLKKERIDTAILSYYTFLYLSKQDHNDFYIAKKHHDTFTRHIMLPKSQNNSLYLTLNSILICEDFTKHWKQRLLNYTMPVH